MLAPGKKLPDSHVKLWDHTERLSGSYGDINFGTRARKAAENYSKYMSEEGEESGVSTPPLWGNSPTRSPRHRYNHYRSMSPSSRAQAIARGQRELMEMVSRMPEGCYELSLKDIVEHPMVDVKQESSSTEKSITKAEAMRRKSEKSDRKAAPITKSGSIDNGGFLLKMVFPLSWGSRNKKKKISTMTDSAKDGRVSPRPLLFDGPAKGADADWWKRRHSDSVGNESGGFSSNSGSSKSSASSSSRSSSRNSSSRHTSGGCCPFIFIKKGKRVG